MTAASIGRITALCVALAAGAAAAFVYNATHARREAALETSAAPSPSTPSQPPPGARDGGSPALAAAVNQATAMVAELSASPDNDKSATGKSATDKSPTDKSAPVLDIVRVERTGDAVIAGRAGPGAVVELLRDGERLDRTVADPTGQFAMVPPRLPAGSYELTLSARTADGTLATSKFDVAVAEDQTGSIAGAAQSRAAEAHPPAEPASHTAKQQNDPVSRLRNATAAATPSDQISSSPVAGTGVLTKVVSRGDSLWRISRVTYGEGTRYVVIYKANRNRIRDPDLIYPGQTLVVPAKGH